MKIILDPLHPAEGLTQALFNHFDNRLVIKELLGEKGCMPEHKGKGIDENSSSARTFCLGKEPMRPFEFQLKFLLHIGPQSTKPQGCLPLHGVSATHTC